MFTLDEIKKEAETAAFEEEINWDMIDNPTEKEFLESRLSKVATMIPHLESLYTKLSSGKSVILPDAESPLRFEEVEHYAELVAEELFSAYILQSIYDRYEKVNSIIALSGSME